MGKMRHIFISLFLLYVVSVGVDGQASVRPPPPTFQLQCPDRCLSLPKFNVNVLGRNEMKWKNDNDYEYSAGAQRSSSNSINWYYYSSAINKCLRFSLNGIPHYELLKTSNIYYSKSSCERTCGEPCSQNQDDIENYGNEANSNNNQNYQVESSGNANGKKNILRAGTWASCDWEVNNYCGTRVPYIQPGWPNRDCCSYCRYDYYPGTYKIGQCINSYCYCY